MNKIVNNSKIILLLINIIGIFCVLFFQNYLNLLSIVCEFLCIYLFWYFVRDLKNHIILSKRFNVLFYIVHFIVLFLIIRSILFIDKNEMILAINGALFFLQNIIYVIILNLCLILYHKIETKSIKYLESRYSKVSIICFIINVILIIPTVQFFTEDFSILFKITFMLLELILLVFEIYGLIKNNGKKKEWIIYVSFFLNMFAIISIFT